MLDYNYSTNQYFVETITFVKEREPWFSAIPVVHEGFLLIHEVFFKPIHPLELLLS